MAIDSKIPTIGIDCAQRIVQKHAICVGINRSRQADSRFLASRKGLKRKETSNIGLLELLGLAEAHYSALPNLGKITIGQYF
jgi:hypothetical protein